MDRSHPHPHRPLPPVVLDAVVPLAVLGQDGEPLAGLLFGGQFAVIAASLLKDTVNRIGNLVDDGRVSPPDKKTSGTQALLPQSGGVMK